MERIRPFIADDIPQVGRLHQRAFQTDASIGGAEYATYLTGTFLAGPHRVAGIESLVYEEDGRILGFLGVVPVKAALGPRPLWIAV